MSAEDADSEKQRLFVALDLPDAVRAQIAAWQRRHEGLPGLRPVAAENVHLTLAFLGDRDRGEVPRLAGVLESLEAWAVPAVLEPEPVAVPRRRPRLLALGVGSEGAVRLQQELLAALDAAGLGVEERRPFWPHLTVFRVRRKGRGSGPVPQVGELPEAGHAFGFVRIALYRSETRSEGARYSRLAANELPSPGPAGPGSG